MGELVDLIIKIVTYLWPFAIVDQWERGVLYVFGRHWRVWPAGTDGTLAPGLYVVVPFFWKIVPVTVVDVPISGPSQNITLRDGSKLTFSANITVRIANAAHALNRVDNYRDSLEELLTGELAERLARKKPEHVLDVENRAALVRELRQWLNEEAAQYGVEVQTLKFPNFVARVPMLRLLVDSALPTQTGW